MTTGYEGDILTYWDSTTGKEVVVDTSQMSFKEKMAIRDQNKLGYYTNAAGDQVYGTRPAATYQEPDQGDIMEGYDPAPRPSNYALPGEEHLVPEVVQPPQPEPPTGLLDGVTVEDVVGAPPVGRVDVESTYVADGNADYTGGPEAQAYSGVEQEALFNIAQGRNGLRPPPITRGRQS